MHVCKCQTQAHNNNKTLQQRSNEKNSIQTVKLMCLAEKKHVNLLSIGLEKHVYIEIRLQSLIEM